MFFYFFFLRFQRLNALSKKKFRNDPFAKPRLQPHQPKGQDGQHQSKGHSEPHKRHPILALCRLDFHHALNRYRVALRDALYDRISAQLDANTTPII